MSGFSMRRIVRLVGMTSDVELVDLQELFRFGFGRTGHAGELLVHAEVVLEGDRGERLVFLLDATPSFASTAWCRPSLHRRPGIRRPVNSSTMMTSPSLTTYSTSRLYSVCARRAWLT